MNHIVEQIGSIVTAMQDLEGKPYYMYGHRVEINERLLKKNDDKVFKYQKYPLIALRWETPEDVSNGMVDYNLNIVFLYSTEKKNTAEQRHENVIKPILTPLYEQFLIELKRSGLFQWEGDQKTPPHTKLDRPYLGVSQENGNIKNIFSDPLDGIEITNLRIKGRRYEGCDGADLADARITTNINGVEMLKSKPYSIVDLEVVNSEGTQYGSKLSSNEWEIPDIQYQVGANPIVEIPYTDELIVIPDDCPTLTAQYNAASDAERITLFQGLSAQNQLDIYSGLTDAERLALFVGLPSQDQIDLYGGLTDAQRFTLYDSLSNAQRLYLFTQLSATKQNQIVLQTYDYTKLFSGQVTSYQTGDDKHQWDNIYAPEIATWPTNRPWVFPIIDPTNFNLLLTNNIFGSKQRFTDDLGTALYASGVLIDHALGVMVDLTFKAASTWTSAISGAVASTFYGKNDWRIGNVNFWALFTKRAQNGNYIAGLPPVTFLSVPPNSSDRFLWASTSGDGSLTTLANQYILRQGTETLVRNVTGSAAKSSTTPQSIYIRKCFTYNAGTGLMELS
jgi:hypothetical protein